MDKTIIADGVTLNRISITKFKTNFICIDFILPLSEETATKAALLAFVLKHGCRKLPGIAEIACKAEEIYGAEVDISVRKKGDYQVISFYIDYVDSSYLPDNPDIDAMAAELLNNIVFDPLVENDSFVKTIVENEKSNLRDIIGARKNNKTLYAVKRCAELIAENQPHSIYEFGDINELNSISAEGLYSFYKEFIARSNVQIFAIGNYKDNYIVDLYTKMFSFKRNPYPVNNTVAALGEYRECNESAQVEQAKLSLGFTFDSQGLSRACITLFLILFGASPNSLLFMNVREKLSLCYYCSATIEKLKDYMIVYSGVLPEKLQTAKEEILNQLEIIKNVKFSEADLDAAKSTYINNLNSIYDNAVSIEEAALAKALSNEEFNIEKTKAELLSFSSIDVAQIAKRMKLVISYTLYNEVNINEQ